MENVLKKITKTSFKIEKEHIGKVVDFIKGVLNVFVIIYTYDLVLEFLSPSTSVRLGITALLLMLLFVASPVLRYLKRRRKRNSSRVRQLKPVLKTHLRHKLYGIVLYKNTWFSAHHPPLVEVIKEDGQSDFCELFEFEEGEITDIFPPLDWIEM